MSKLDYTAAGQAMQRTREPTPHELAIQHASKYLTARHDKLTKWVRFGVRSEALIRFCLLDLQQQPKLALCDPGSIFLGLLACAQTGLEPGALRQEAFLVPFAGKAQFMIGYRGIVKLARRSREVTSLPAHVVMDGDTFELDLGNGSAPVHRPLLRGDRGAMIGAYAAAKLRGGDYEVEWMDREDLELVRSRAQRGAKESDAWALWPDQMYRKTPIRRLGKRLPLGADYYLAEQVEQAQAEGKYDVAIAALDDVTHGAASADGAANDASAEILEQLKGGE